MAHVVSHQAVKTEVDCFELAVFPEKGTCAQNGDFSTQSTDELGFEQLFTDRENLSANSTKLRDCFGTTVIKACNFHTTG